MKQIKNHKAAVSAAMILTAALIIITVLLVADHYNLIPKKYFTANDFDIQTIYSDTDFNQNGIDDYTDFLLGARADAQNHPDYDGSYFEGGYPPDDIGVCTDVVWRA